MTYNIVRTMTSSSIILGTKYSKILSHFPQNNTSLIFAYGSGVKKQLYTELSSKSVMIDLIFCVDNTQKWHESNLKRNKSHYSALKFLGSETITRIQRNSGAKVYYNTLVPVEDYFVKYGVIATEDLITDLLEWSDIYLAGRLHKPVEILAEPKTADLQTALKLNMQSAVHATLLLLPETFTEYEFYYTLSNISYSGDFRMTFGESKNKVENIVKPQLEGFRNLYKPFLNTLNDYVDFPAQSQSDQLYCAQDVSHLAKLHHLNQLPRWPQKALTRFWNKGSFRQDTEDVLRAIAYDADSDSIVRRCINEIVWKSSVTQSLKGILTAGFVKSVRYSSRKVVKMFS